LPLSLSSITPMVLLSLIVLTHACLASAAPAKLGCDDHGVWHADGERWLRGHYFLVVCIDGIIQMQHCVTDVGSIIPLGTKLFVENEIEYTCLDEATDKKSEKNYKEHDVEGSGELGSMCEDTNDLAINSFMICCISRRIKGCVDYYGDWVKQGHFVTENRSLKLCTIQPGGLKGRIENRGCFNGSRDDDVEEASLHIDKYTVWREGDIDLRCGENGIVPYRCYVKEKKGKEKQYYVGSAWIDKNGDFNICK
ncbi:hypothetical protein PFISCL1PPCAC_9976, partial [Pristionchus fissidentatus]